MKQEIFSTIFMVGLFVGIAANAQKEVPDCNFNVRQAITYLEGDQGVARDSLKAVEYLRPCVAQGNPYAQLLMARLYLHGANKADYQKGFRLTKKAARQDLAVAATDLADLFKYGIGSAQNFKKAKKWYKKAYKLGDAKGAYGVGYLHYKGLGKISQNYRKAIKWFEKSDHPMARHWLGVSHYFGYGVKADKPWAMQLLGNNPIENSRTMLDCMEFHSRNGQNAAAQADGLDRAMLLGDSPAADQGLPGTALDGKWAGAIIKLDWSGEHPEQALPITFRLSHDAEAQTTAYTYLLNGKEGKGVAANQDNMLFFEGLEMELERLYFNADNERHVTYDILSADMALKAYNGKTYLTALLKSHVEEMGEPGNSFALVLSKESDVTQNGKEIAEETAQGLAEQQGHFIKLYPNPFERELYIAYSLERPGFVQVQVSDLHGTQRHMVEQGVQQPAGDYVYYLDSAGLKSGANVVTVLVNGTKHTKITVKK